MIRVNINTLEATRGPVPKRLRGLAAVTLNNLQTLGPKPLPAELVGFEWWPEVAGVAAADDETQKISGSVLIADPVLRVIVVMPTVVDLTPIEIMHALTRAKDGAVNAVVDRQYKEAASGTTFNGMAIGTTLDLVAELDAAIAGSGRSSGKIRKVNMRSGRAEMSKNDLVAMQDAMDDHRQACNNRGYDLCLLISKAATRAAVATVLTDGLDNGWPV